MGFQEVAARQHSDYPYRRGWVNRESGLRLGEHMNSRSGQATMIAHQGHHPSWAIHTVFVDPGVPAWHPEPVYEPPPKLPPREKKKVKCLRFNGSAPRAK